MNILIRSILLYSLTMVLLVFSCQKPDVRQTFENNCENSRKLQTVLEHYKDEPLKAKAAKFLLENMDDHFAYNGEAVDIYSRYMDSVFSNYDGDRVFWIMKYDTILQKIGIDLELSQGNRLYDSQTVTVEFLTEHIDSAFTVWQQNWNKQYSFEMFCRYVLPYRIENEKISLWRRIFTTPSWVRDAYASNQDNSTYAYGMANDILGSMRSVIYYPSQFLPDLPLTALKHIKSASCKEYAHLCVTILRAHGLPATIDFTPQWGNRGLGHEWCVFFPDNNSFIPFNPGERLGDHFMKRKEDRLTKVFRQTYERQPESLYMLNKGKEKIPDLFDTPYIMDVTKEYTTTSDIEVQLYDNIENSKFIYLSVFDNQEWSIVHWGIRHGCKATFRNMARNIMYMPVQYSEEKGIVPAGDAFLLDAQGNVHKMKADTNRRITVEVKRKFRDVRSNQFLQGVIGGKFQVSNKEDFSDSLTIYVIPNLKDNKFHVVHPHYTGKFKYFRYLSPDWSRGNMAELYTFNTTGDTLKHKRLIGNFHVRPWCGPDNLFDGNVLSFYDSHDVYNVWYGWELEQPENVASIIFLPRNDDDFIREGEEYELFYWNNGTWMSLGRKTGNFEAVLTYDNVPTNALLRLHNRTKGSEERIFTYENKKQIWW